MKYKIVIITTIILMFCFVLCGCSSTKQNGAAYDFKIVSLDTDVFAQGVPVISEKNEIYTKVTPEKKKVQLVDSSVDLQYVKSSKSAFDDVDIYENQGQGITCQFDANTKKLLRIQFDKILYHTDPTFQEESDYRIWIESILAAFDNAALQNYRYSCQTQFLKTTENSASSEIADYFYVPESQSEEVLSYLFAYTRYIGNVKTTDGFIVCVSPQKGIDFIQYDRQQFAGKQMPEYNQQKVEKTIEANMNAIIDRNRYSCKSYQIKEEYYRYIANQFYLICPVEASLKPKNSDAENNIVVLFDMAIAIETM